jgi:3D (Asp-Asp-Asp) domain-containing protein
VLNNIRGEKQLKPDFPKWRSVLRTAIVLSCSLCAMQMVVMSSKEIVDSKLDAEYLKYKTAAFSHIQFPRFEFLATAYSHDGITKSGLPATTGLIAADPMVLPIGSLVQMDSTEYRGLYQVMDTGRLIKGKRIDVFIPDINSALAFGARRVDITVLRYGYLWQEAQRVASSIRNPAITVPEANLF